MCGWDRKVFVVQMSPRRSSGRQLSACSMERNFPKSYNVLPTAVNFPSQGEFEHGL